MIKKIGLILFMALITLAVATSSAFAGDALVSWDANTDPDLAGYRVYYGTSSGNYLQAKGEGIDAGNNLSYNLTNLSEGTTYYFTVTAYDKAGNESVYAVEVSKTISVSSEIKPTHPRLILTETKLAELQNKANQNTSQWSALKSYCDTYLTTWPSSVEARWGGLLLGMSLIYQVTGDTKYSDRAKEFLDDMVTNCNLSDRNTFRNFGNITALAYDWLYSTLDSSQNTALINKLNSACTLHQGGWSTTFTDSDQVVGNAMAMVFHGITTYGDNSEAMTHLDYGRTTIWNNMISKYISYSQGGIWPEGWKYSSNTLRQLSLLIDGLNTGTGENRWIAYNFADEIVLGLIHSTLPAFSDYFPYSDLEDAEYIIGYRQRNLAVVLSSLASAENQEYIRWWIANSDIPIQKDSQWLEIIYYDPTGKATDYRGIINNDFFASGANVVLSRSGFDTSSTWVSFMSGWSGVDHQHEDANTFQIFRKGQWLSKETIGYGGPSATIEAHNGIMIENSENNGPHVFRNAGPALIKRYEFTNNYVYAVGDAKNRYNSDYYKEYYVQVADREFVFIKPDIIVIYDRVSTTDNTKFKKLIQHYTYEPIVSETTIKSDTGNQKIFTKILLPEDLSIDKIDELVYWSGVPAYQVSNPEKKWHIVATPRAVRAIESFLTVNYLTDSDTMPEMIKISAGNNNMVGAHIQDPTKNYVVMFISDPKGDSVNNVTYIADYSSSVIAKHLLFNMASGGYEVYKNGVKLFSNLAASSGGVLSFESTGGSTFSIVPAGQVPPDTTSPQGTITIDNGAEYSKSTNVSLTLSATDTESGMGSGAEMQFSNDNLSWSTPEAYATTKSWTLESGDGTKTVYVKFKDVAGNWSAAVSDTLTLDTTPPQAPKNLRVQ